MKKIKLIILSSIIMLTAIFLASCVKKPFEITLKLEDGTVYETLFCLKDQSIDLTLPEKEGHTFLGWYLEDGTKVSSPATFEGDTTLFAQFTPKTFTYIFVVEGVTIKEETLPYGSTIVYPEATPEKEPTSTESFTFTGWSNDATILTKDEVFNAEFSSSTRTYRYIFLDEEGNEIKNVVAEAGSIIEYPEDLTKEGDAQYEYRFMGWSSKDLVLEKDITFRPVFEEITKKYTYKFVDEDGSIYEEKTVEYGTMPIEPTVSVIKEIDGVKYELVGWDKEITKVVEDVVYTAVFEIYNPSLEGKKLSILGDSISTFYAPGSEMNSYYTGTNQFYYPLYSSTIKTVNLTWWYKLIKNTEMELGINNSWSGSSAYGSGSSAGMSDGRINTINENGQSDIVIIYLGTNDLVNGFSKDQFSSAISTMINKVKAQGVKDIFLTTLGYTAYTGYSYSEDNRLLYNEELRTLASETGCGIIPLDEYIVNDNYMIYLGDNLHYNAKGAELISKICEKAIKEYFGIEFNEEIDVEHKEVLPEGVLGYITANADSSADFWTDYATKVFFTTSSFTNPQFSTRYLISKNSDGAYYVSNIYKSGDTGAYDCEYVLIISDSHEDKGELLMALESVVVGSIVEFDEALTMPLTLTFKEGSSVPVDPEDPGTEPEVPTVPEGQILVGAYNTGVWTLFEQTVIVYSQDMIDKGSTFVNFHVLKITKDANSDNYTITTKKDAGNNTEFSDCDYYVLIYTSLDAVEFYNKAKVGDTIVIHGDITSGEATLELQ